MSRIYIFIILCMFNNSNKRVFEFEMGDRFERSWREEREEENDVVIFY